MTSLHHPQVVAGLVPPITTPPESFFEIVEPEYREKARQFYSKHLSVHGLSVVAAGVVADEALVRTYDIVSHMLAGRPDILEKMVESGMYLTIIGREQVYTDIPEYSDHPNPDYVNERVRGTGGKPTSFGEENLLSLPIDRYDDESIAVHEFAHTIDFTLELIDPNWRQTCEEMFQKALDKGLWHHTYAGSNVYELWAESVQSYFDCNRVNNWNHGPIGTREQLKAYDPETYEWLKATFNLAPHQDWRYRWLQTLPCVVEPPLRFNIAPFYTKFTWAREFPVIGREASEEALLKANDTIRKMFAYRHDILKALIADGVKLVVLGPNEKLIDLPECRAVAQNSEVDLLARVLYYHPECKLLVVAQENVLGDHRKPYVGDNQVIRVMADAFFQITGFRSVDPNWEHRGEDVQQYELRVKRLDVTFGAKVKMLYLAAIEQGLWRGTSAVINPANYWARGVLAYFNAAGHDAAPVGSPDFPFPISTREALKRYDSELYDLVHEAMAYGGHVDWYYETY